MSASLSSTRRLLERLGHEELVDSPESHSRAGGGGRGGGARIGYFEKALGWRRLANFRAIREVELRRALSGLGASASDAATFAWRGRLLRLLGETAEARLTLERSLGIRRTPEAAAWLGELELYFDPEAADEALAEASRLAPGWDAPHLWRGLAHLKAARPAKAAAEFDLALRLGPPKAGHLLRLARSEAFFRAKDHGKALDEARLAIRADRNSPAGYYMAGGIRFAAGDLAGAAEDSNQARNRDLNLEGPFFASLGVVSDWDQPAVYLKSLDKAIAAHPAQAVLYAVRAELKRDPKLCLYEEALADYRKAAELAPDCSWIRSVLARAEDYSQGGRSSLKSFARAIRLCPASGWAYAWRGAVRARLGETERALEDFGRALKLMPWYSFAYAWRGAQLNRLGRRREALADLDTAIRLDPHYAFSFYERFQAKRALKDDAGAATDLNTAFASDPKYTWLGPRAAETDPAKRACLLRGLDEAILRSPREAWLRAWRGYSLLQWGDFAAALADLDAAAAEGLTGAELEGWRGSALLGLGRLTEAVARLEESVRLDPRSWHAFKTLSEARDAQGLKTAALEAIARAAALAPTTVSVLLSRARLERELGRDVEALASLSRAGELDPAFSETFALIAEIRLARGETELAARAAENAVSAPRPSGKAYLIRGLVRQRLADFEGQISDFAAALRIAPALFQEEDRRRIEALVGRGRSRRHAE